MEILEKILDFIKKPLVAGVIGLVIGLIIGLPILGWWLWPVEWVDADPTYLTDAYKQEYLKMAVEAYMFNQDEATALRRWDQLGESAPETLKALEADTEIAKYLEDYKKVVMASEPTPIPGTLPTVTTAPGTKKTGFNLTALGVGLGVSCLLLLAVIGALVYFLFFRKNKGKTTQRPRTIETTHAQPVDTSEETVQVQAGEMVEEAAEMPIPVAQFVPTYKFGDDLFDESNSIDAASGEFLGEYGVGILQTIGTGEPSKITAFEVWIFDKVDAQTVTKVIMSDYAFKDPGIIQSLESKGEPVLVEVGNQFSLETATLELVVRVLDATYGEDQSGLPQNSYFENLTLELTVYQKPV